MTMLLGAHKVFPYSGKGLMPVVMLQLERVDQVGPEEIHNSLSFGLFPQPIFLALEVLIKVNTKLSLV